MILTMQREPSRAGATLSRLFNGAQFICDVLEDEVREVVGTPVAQWKIPGTTAIPAGRYQLVFEYSNRFGPDTLTVKGVEGFAGIRVHGGNTAANTEGCPLPGTRNSVNTVSHSQSALRRVRSIVSAAIERGEDVWLEILPALQEA